VWGHLASLALAQRDGERAAAAALRQAQRCGLADGALLQQLGDQYAALGRQGSAADLLARAAAVQDSVQVRASLGP
jgi:hypothetical protein